MPSYLLFTAIPLREHRPDDLKLPFHVFGAFAAKVPPYRALAAFLSNAQLSLNY
jgi:hypothetical protein